jgi:hypothetical protein
MITQYVDKSREYSGNSTDIKPITGVRNNDEFIEIDTGTRYKFDKDTDTWVEYTPKVGINASIEVGDITIGSVAIKDAVTEDTVHVDSNGNLSVIGSMTIKDGTTEDTVNIDSDGNLSVKLSNKTSSIIFHNASISPALGTELTVSDYKDLRMSVTGTATSFTLVFKGQLGSVVSTILGIESTALTLVSSTSTKNTIYDFDISGYDKVWFDLTVVSGGNITVVGKVVS